jgi:hypothetical protein
MIRVDGTDAGVLSFEVQADHVFLKDVALLPQSRGRASAREWFVRPGVTPPPAGATTGPQLEFAYS